MWNAVVAATTGVPLRTWANEFDSRCRCGFSQGAGARRSDQQLVGPRPFITRAGRVRKLFGAVACVEAGVLAAAAALYALDHHCDRLAEDHRNARTLAEAVADTPTLRLTPSEVQTNILIIEVDRDLGKLPPMSRRTLNEHGVLGTDDRSSAPACGDPSRRLRSEGKERAAEVFRKGGAGGGLSRGEFRS